MDTVVLKWIKTYKMIFNNNEFVSFDKIARAPLLKYARRGCQAQLSHDTVTYLISYCFEHQWCHS